MIRMIEDVSQRYMNYLYYQLVNRIMHQLVNRIIDITSIACCYNAN